MKGQRIGAVIGVVCIAAAAAAGMIWGSQRRVKETAISIPAESAEAQVNPSCGLYRIYGFTPGKDDLTQAAAIASDAESDSSVSLCLLELNLEPFRAGSISEEALKEIGELLDKVGGTGKKLIIRFLYDWDGQAVLTEPDSLNTILEHMTQVGPILLQYRKQIFTLQGLFIGNWGEMNGSRYGDAASLRTLAEKLEEVTDHQIRLAVRTPAQWRTIEGVSKEDLTEAKIRALAEKSNIGLFNDGLTGSATDYGTYAGDSDGSYESRTDRDLKKINFQDFDPQTPWPRDAEMAFQGILSESQPIGGEAIHVSEWNDLTETIRSFRRMHASYLNIDYDQAVWQKWAGSSVSKSGVWNGEKGDDYIRAHLGCRYVLTKGSLYYNWWQNTISASISIKNEGFAPAYRKLKLHFLILDEDEKIVEQKTVPFDPSALSGGTEDRKSRKFEAGLSAENLKKGSYRIAVCLDDAEGNAIRFGNKGPMKTADGTVCCPIGTVEAR